MVVGFDLNGSIRDIDRQIGRYYAKEFDRSFDYENFDSDVMDKYRGFNFRNTLVYNKFMYEDYTLEIFGHANECSRGLMNLLNGWFVNIIDMELSNIKPMIISTKEYSPSIHSTYYFLSKTGCKIREVYLGKNNEDVWDKCDVIITADPNIIINKPDNKICVKINKKYNKDLITDYSFDNLIECLKGDNLIKILTQ